MRMGLYSHRLNMHSVRVSIPGNAGTSRFAHAVLVLVALFIGIMSPHESMATQDTIQTTFVVKYVAADAVYLEGGSSTGLGEGQKLTIKRKPEAGKDGEEKFIAMIEIDSVASASAVGKILSANADIIAGDIAYLSADDIARLKVLQSSSDARKYPQVVAFTESDPLQEELRESLPTPPLPEVNRTRGRIGFEYGSLHQSSGGQVHTQIGFMLRMDATRLAGTHWNLSGYYRGRLQSEGRRSQATTLNDLINRTYHLSLSYDNPDSHWVAGVGRLYIPWASSLSTIDGFYLGRRHGRVTAGIFGGSAPDPTSWNYDPNRHLGGAFFNVQGGSFESFRMSSTSGVALTRVAWYPDRQFAFFENGIFYKRYLSIYSNLEADLLRGPQISPFADVPGGRSKVVLSRSYLTVHIQPAERISFDIGENYFRDIPTFDERLIGTGLLDKYLFQGLNGGFRIELPYRLGVYANVGHSNRTGDARASWDYLYGITLGNLWHTGIRADARYSRFDSSFGNGTYGSLSLSRYLGDGLRFEFQAGQQNVTSSYTNDNRARFINGNVDWILGSRYFLGFSATAYRGGLQSYDQFFVTLGYRFDNRRK